MASSVPVPRGGAVDSTEASGILRDPFGHAWELASHRSPTVAELDAAFAGCASRPGWLTVTAPSLADRQNARAY